MEKDKKQFEGFDPEPRTWDFPMVINGWVHKISGTEFKVLWYILRHTYGWQKNSDAISYRQFRYGIKKKDGEWLDKGTGLSFPAIKRAIDNLVKNGFIEVEKTKDKKGHQSISCYKPRLKEIKSGNPRLNGTESAGLNQPGEATIVNSEQSLNITSGLSTSTPRKEITFNNDDYKKVIVSYEELKGIKFQGPEYKPIQQDIKTMFLSNRKPEEIIRCMKWFKEKSESEERKYEWVKSWTIRTIKLKIAEFLAGKLGSETEDEDVEIPEYAKKWDK